MIGTTGKWINGLMCVWIFTTTTASPVLGRCRAVLASAQILEIENVGHNAHYGVQHPDI